MGCLGASAANRMPTRAKKWGSFGCSYVAAKLKNPIADNRCSRKPSIAPVLSP
jgi:hypothetical protein